MTHYFSLKPDNASFMCMIEAARREKCNMVRLYYKLCYFYIFSLYCEEKGSQFKVLKKRQPPIVFVKDAEGY